MTQIWKFVVSIIDLNRQCICEKKNLISAPFPPTNITVSASVVSQNIYSMNVSWNKPDRQPLYYLLTIDDHTSNITERKIPGVANIRINFFLFFL